MNLELSQTLLFFSTLLVSGALTYIWLKEKSTVLIEHRFFSYSALLFLGLLAVLTGIWFINIWVFTASAGILFGLYTSWMYAASQIRIRERNEKYKNG